MVYRTETHLQLFNFDRIAGTGSTEYRLPIPSESRSSTKSNDGLREENFGFSSQLNPEIIE
jgi:hypothetical protein